MKKHILPFLGVLALMTSCTRQDKQPETETETPQEATISRKCASHEVLEQQLAADPARRQALEELERKTENFQGRQARLAGTLYIPVVVHVVMTNPNLVSDDQIRSQIDVLNKDFTKTNSELTGATAPYLAGYSLSNVADCQIQYVVTQVVRKASNVATFGTNDAVKKSAQGGSDAVNATTHLNMWVCDLSSGLLGYAQFPNGAAATDGVVCDYQAFGTTSTGFALYSAFNKGRTATHEVGHWVNLRHIWGDARCGTDYVTDTPPHDADNGGCPTTTHTSRCAGKPLEQWMNYMDYTNDACMYMFSAGQKTRMDAAIDGPRAAYVRTTAPTSVL